MAIAIDAMKRFTFTFILPGVAKEYALSAPGHKVHGALPVALYPFSGILGTVIGSFIWGSIADRVGRRRAVLPAVILFIATSICGAMPPVEPRHVLLHGARRRRAAANRVHTALGDDAGARTRAHPWAHRWCGHRARIPRDERNRLVDAAEHRLAHHVVLGTPDGVILIVLNRFIPESPRFLIARGRSAEAHTVMQRFGAVTETVPQAAQRVADKVGWASLFRKRLLSLSIAIVLYGFAWGIVDFGFLTWLPVDLAGRGIGAAKIGGILTNASLFALPGAVVAALLYGRWSSKWTMVIVAAANVGALLAFAIARE